MEVGTSRILSLFIAASRYSRRTFCCECRGYNNSVETDWKRLPAYDIDGTIAIFWRLTPSISNSASALSLTILI